MKLDLFLVVSSLVYSASLRAPLLPDTGVRLFLASENRTLPNQAIVSAPQFRVDDLENTKKDGISDAIWCQAAPSLGPVEYQWYGPGGLPIMKNTTLDNPNKFNTSTTVFVVFDGTTQVGLARPVKKGIGNNDGLYKCMITDGNGTSHTLEVGVYREGTYNMNTGPVVNSSVHFSIISSCDSDNPQFTLSFNVSNSPATTVNCSVNEQFIENTTVSRTVLSSGLPILTEVTVSISQWTGGVYNCSVSNDRVEEGTISENGTNFTATPGYVTYPINDNETVLYMALATPGSTYLVTLYEVFYVIANGNANKIGTINDPNFALSNETPTFILVGHNDVSLSSTADFKRCLLTASTVISSSSINPASSTPVCSSPLLNTTSVLVVSGFTLSGVLGSLLLISITVNMVLILKIRCCQSQAINSKPVELESKETTVTAITEDTIVNTSYIYATVNKKPNTTTTTAVHDMDTDMYSSVCVGEVKVSKSAEEQVTTQPLPIQRIEHTSGPVPVPDYVYSSTSKPGRTRVDPLPSIVDEAHTPHQDGGECLYSEVSKKKQIMTQQSTEAGLDEGHYNTLNETASSSAVIESEVVEPTYAEASVEKVDSDSSAKFFGTLSSLPSSLPPVPND